MKVVQLLALAVSAICLPVCAAHAAENDRGVYVGGGITYFDYSESGFLDDASLDGVYAKLGVFVNDYLSAELRAGLSIGDDDVAESFGGNASVELDSFYGAYLRGGFPVTKRFYPYALLGYTASETTVTRAFSFGNNQISVESSQRDQDPAVGAGADFYFDNGIIFNVEYLTLLNGDAYELEGLTVGVAKSF